MLIRMFILKKKISYNQLTKTKTEKQHISENIIY